MTESPLEQAFIGPKVMSVERTIMVPETACLSISWPTLDVQAPPRSIKLIAVAPDVMRH
jgi:hypothetical protein